MRLIAINRLTALKIIIKLAFKQLDILDWIMKKWAFKTKNGSAKIEKHYRSKTSYI